MDNNSSPVVALLCAILSPVSAFFAAITLHQVQLFMTVVASGIGMISGLFAVRHYYYATKKTIAELKKNSSQASGHKP